MNLEQELERAGTTNPIAGPSAPCNPYQDESGDENSSQKGWTGSQDAEAGPSTFRRKPIPGFSNPSTPTTAELDDKKIAMFAERFKYSVISSGLLDKDLIAAPEPSMPELWSTDEIDPQPRADPVLRTRAYSLQWDHHLPWRRLMEIVRSKWDIVAAGVALAVGLAVVVGIWSIVISAFCLGSGLLASELWPWRRRPSNVGVNLNEASASGNPIHSTLDSRIEALDAFASSCTAHDVCLARSLTLLSRQKASSPDSLSQKPLRLAVHRLCDSMTDILANATSEFMGLVKEQDLHALGEMYDVPLVGRRFHAAAERRTNVVDSSQMVTVPSPRRQPPIPLQLLSPPSTIRKRTGLPFHPASAIPMVTTRSLPLRPNRHTHHLSLNRSPASNDKYTSIPQRTPRLSKRASWDQRAWDEVYGDEGILTPSPTLSRRPSRKRTIHERKITEADEENSDSGNIADNSFSSDEVKSSDGGISFVPRPLSLPTSPITTSKAGFYTPKRSSPLSNHIESFKRSALKFPQSASLTESALRLASSSQHNHPSASSIINPLLESPKINPKGRSLQNMPYYHSSDAEEPGTASTTTHNRRHSSISNLQAVRSQSATGSRKSISSMSSVVGSPTPASLGHATRKNQRDQTRISRVPSVSPLTTPALQASCLGLHLKRRKIAICLLALDWNANEEYWEGVRDILNDLSQTMKAEAADLERIRSELVEEVEREKETEEYLLNPIPPWQIELVRAGATDYAPRNSNEKQVLQHLSAMQLAMVDLWAITAQSRAQLTERTESDYEALWTNMRRHLLVVSRELEKGKEVSRKLKDETKEVDHVTDQGEVQEPLSIQEVDDDLPEFMTSWEEGTTTRSTSIGTDRPITPPIPPDNDDLPPPGMDEVFEALPDPSVNGRGVRRRKVEYDTSDMINKREMMMQSGQVVEELRGLMGVIKSRKEGNIKTKSEIIPNPSQQRRGEGRKSGLRTSESSESMNDATPRASQARIRPLTVQSENGSEIIGQGKDLKRSFVFPLPRKAVEAPSLE